MRKKLKHRKILHIDEHYDPDIFPESLVELAKKYPQLKADYKKPKNYYGRTNRVNCLTFMPDSDHHYVIFFGTVKEKSVSRYYKFTSKEAKSVEFL